MMEVLVTISYISYAKLQSVSHHQQTNTQFFTGQMSFLLPSQQCQSTEGKSITSANFQPRLWPLKSRLAEGCQAPHPLSDASSLHVCIVCIQVTLCECMIIKIFCSWLFAAVLFPRHTCPEARDNSINLIHTLRDYLHYHIKCSKVSTRFYVRLMCLAVVEWR